MKSLILDKLTDLVGMKSWGVSIGPAGINMHFGRRRKYPNSNQYHGEIALLIQTHTSIWTNGKIITKSLFPQNIKETKIYRKYLNNRKVILSKIHPTKKNLHLLFSRNIIFNAYPDCSSTDLSWNIYDHRIENPPGILVYKEKNKIVEQNISSPRINRVKKNRCMKMDN